MDQEVATNNRKVFLVEALGWYGAIAIVGAYTLVSFDALDTESAWYQLLNLTGGLGIVLVSWTKRAIQPAALNLVWSIIAIAALIRIWI